MPWRHNFFFLSFPKASLPEFSCPMLAPSNAVTNDKTLLAALNAINPKFGSFYENVCGDIFALPLISQQNKCLFLEAIDVANQSMGAVGAPFEPHVTTALPQGSTIEGIEELSLLTCADAAANKSEIDFTKLNQIKSKI